MDSRFHLKVTFCVYGKVYPWDCSLNWSAGPGEIDERITEFFRTSYADAFCEWSEKEGARNEKRRKKEIEESERAELKRLREKYHD